MTRRYQQQARAESAEHTRRRILDAVARRLREAPTEAVSLDRVAHLAGVARSTVYLVFGSRSGLFDAFADDLWTRTGQSSLIAAVADPDARQHLRGGIAAACRMFANDPQIYRVLHSMGRLDPDSVGGALQKMAAERAGGMAYVARRLADDAALRADVTVRLASDMLWALTSFEVFDTLCVDRERTTDDAIDLIVTMAERAVCRPVAADGDGGAANSTG